MANLTTNKDHFLIVPLDESSLYNSTETEEEARDFIKKHDLKDVKIIMQTAIYRYNDIKV